MKKIALTQRLLENESYFEVREMLDVNWSKLFKKLDFLPVVLPYEYDFTTMDFEGIILTGGNDLNSINACKINLIRDEFEKKLIKYCIENNKAIFGVCRGMQILNEYFGGNLKQVQNHIGRHILDNGSTVNSFHNYAIDKLGKGLNVIAKSIDNEIEIVAHKEYKIYAQMSHPEREIPFDKNDIEKLKDFFND